MKVYFVRALDRDGQVKGTETTYEFPSEDIQKFVSEKYCTPYVEVAEGYVFDRKGEEI